MPVPFEVRPSCFHYIVTRLIIGLYRKAKSFEQAQSSGEPFMFLPVLTGPSSS